MSEPIPEFIKTAADRALLAGKHFRLGRLPAEIRRRLVEPEKIAVSKYARLYRIVTAGPHQGPWRHHLSPHTVKIMDVFGQPWVREIWYCASEQSGKTQTMLNCLHWAVGVSPGDVFYLMPTEATARNMVESSLVPLLTRSRSLKKMVSDRADDTTLTRIRLENNVVIRPAWANSAASMAAFPAKYCFGDEVDKYPAMTGREASPIELLKKRNRLYNGLYKRFFASTPAQGVIYQGMMDCQQVWEMRQRCPHCGELFRPDGAGLVLPPGITSPSELDATTPISYACTQCGALIDEVARQELLRHPDWYCIKGGDLHEPSSVGFHHRAWDCRDVPLYEIARHWLMAQKGGVGEKLEWANGYEVENFVQEYREREEDALLALMDDRPEGLVPGGGVVQGLVCGSDTQDNGHYYWIDAVGWGLEGERWRVRAGFVDSDAALLHAVFGVEYRDAEGNVYPVALMVKDSAGHRTGNVYDMCLRHPGRVVAYRGTGRRSRPFSITRPDVYPGTNRPIPGGVPLYTCDSHFYKDLVTAKLMMKPDEVGAWHFDRGFTLEQASHLCAEYRDENMRWQCPKNRPNHYWDSCVMALIASEILEYKFRARPVSAPRPASATARTGDGGVNHGANPFTGGRQMFGAGGFGGRR